MATHSSGTKRNTSVSLGFKLHEACFKRSVEEGCPSLSAWLTAAAKVALSEEGRKLMERMKDTPEDLLPKWVLYAIKEDEKASIDRRKIRYLRFGKGRNGGTVMQTPGAGEAPTLSQPTAPEPTADRKPDAAPEAPQRLRRSGHPRR